MISLFRKFARSKFAMGLLILTALGLLVTGGTQTDLLGSLQAPKVVSAGERGLSPVEFRTEMDRRLEQIQAEQRRAVTYEELFAQASLARDMEACDPLRDEIVRRWGDKALVAISLTLMQARMYPTLKYALGYGKACSRVKVAGEAVAPLRLAA